MWHYNHTVLLFAKYMKHAKMSVPLPPKCKLLLKFPATPIFTLILLLYTCSSIIYEWRVKIYLQRSWNYLVNRWFYFFINIPRTLNWQFLQLDLEFSSCQRKSFQYGGAQYVWSSSLSRCQPKFSTFFLFFPFFISVNVMTIRKRPSAKS